MLQYPPVFFALSYFLPQIRSCIRHHSRVIPYHLHLSQRPQSSRQQLPQQHCACVFCRNHRATGLCFNFFSGVAGYRAALLCHSAVFFQPLRILSLGEFCCGASANIFSASSNVLILSRRFSFFNPFRFLYCRVFSPDHAFVTSSVKMAYSCPFCTPCALHASVNSLRARMVCRRWLIHSGG